MPKPDNVGVGVAILIIGPSNQILLLKRQGAHAAGTWACPGGWIDYEDDSPEAACRRELKEELGLDLVWGNNVSRFSNLNLITAVSEDHKDIGIRSVTLYYAVDFLKTWGTPQIMEPNKAAELKWFNPQEVVVLNDNHELQLFPNLRNVLLGIMR